MKILSFKGLLILLIFLITFFLVYSNFFKKTQTNKTEISEIEEKNFTNTNVIRDIKYSSKDLRGNEYLILAKEGEIDLDDTDIIYLKNVKAFIKLIEKNEKITVISDFGKYNTITYDTIFSQNVNIEYLDNKITGDYLDFSMIKNLLIISKNVVYTNPNNILKADVVELDTITKDTKIFMYDSKDQVNVESRN
tara:strand:- start:1445 stop:2023 length:579 start_codon:yes stop_codon:yes gene_type:complete